MQWFMGIQKIVILPSEQISFIVDEWADNSEANLFGLLA